MVPSLADRTFQLRSESVPALSTTAASQTRPKPAGPSGHKAFPVAFLPSSLPAFAVAPEAKRPFKQASFDEFWERQQTHQSFARRRDVFWPVARKPQLQAVQIRQSARRDEKRSKFRAREP